MEENYRIHGKFIILRENEDLWAINILPDDILIDNYHGYPHIHINKNRKMKISIQNLDKIFFKIINHINMRKGLDKYKLLDELR